MTEDGLCLLTRDPREPLQEFIDGGATLEILEEGPNPGRAFP